MSFKKIFYTLAFLSGISNVKAQCPDCKTTANNAIPAYTVVAGEVLCVPASLTYTGIITVNGGTICNLGTVQNITLNSGKFNNYGAFKRSGALNIYYNGEVVITCFPNSVVDIGGAINIQGSTVSDKITINQGGSSIFSTGASFNCSKGALFINSNVIPGTKFFGKNIFNVAGQFNITSNASLNMQIDAFSTFNINGATSFDGKYNKTIVNYGEMNFDNSFNIGGNGQNTGIFTFQNYGNLTVKAAFNASYINGTTIIENNAKNKKLFFIGSSYTQNKDNTTFTNNGDMVIGLDCSVDGGGINNNGNLQCRDLQIKNGSFANNFYSLVNRDLTLVNTNSILKNSNEITVKGKFDSQGTVTMGKRSTLFCLDFVDKAGGSINGPDTLGNDSANYALIMISRLSDNNGYLRGYLDVYDETPPASGLKLDNYHNNANRIAPTVIIGPPCFRNVFTAALSSNPLSPVCAGTSVLLTANAYNSISSAPAPVNNYLWLPANVTTVPPVNTFNSGPLTANTVLSVKVTFANGCTKTQNITINVNTPLPVSATALPPAVIIGQSSNLSALPSGFSTYIWQPGSLSGQNVTVNPLVTTTYNLTATDVNGCKSQTSVIVHVNPPPYAMLKRSLDGGFYSVGSDKKVYFQYTGEYNNGALNYKIYKTDRSNLAGCPITSSLKTYGDNRYSVDVSTCLTASSNYYVLEVTNEKNEMFYLKFKY